MKRYISQTVNVAKSIHMFRYEWTLQHFQGSREKTEKEEKRNERKTFVFDIARW